MARRKKHLTYQQVRDNPPQGMEEASERIKAIYPPLSPRMLHAPYGTVYEARPKSVSK